MELLSEFRYPTRWYSKLVAAVLALGFFTLLAAAIISAFVVYGIVTPRPGGGSMDLANFPGHPEDVPYQVDGLGNRDGWFFPGLRQAPTIILCPGYQDTRGELLPLATALQNQQYNVFLFDFAGNGASAGYSTLGYREVQELRAVLVTLAQRDDVDNGRFGLWGTNLGAYAALALAESDPRVRAVALESVYDRPTDLLNVLVARNGMASLPLLRSFTAHGFSLLEYNNRATPPLSARLGRLAGVPKLFIEASDEPGLADYTSQLYLVAPDPKQYALITQGRYAAMLDDQKRGYENRILSFFLLNLPL